MERVHDDFGLWLAGRLTNCPRRPAEARVGIPILNPEEGGIPGRRSRGLGAEVSEEAAPACNAPYDAAMALVQACARMSMRIESFRDPGSNRETAERERYSVL